MAVGVGVEGGGGGEEIALHRLPKFLTEALFLTASLVCAESAVILRGDYTES